MSTYTDPLSPTFALPPNKLKAYIFTRGYFSKTLLPIGTKGTTNTRFCEVRCLLPVTPNNPSIICNNTSIIKWDLTSTGNLIKHLTSHHPTIPKNKEEEERLKSLENLEGKYTNITILLY